MNVGKYTKCDLNYPYDNVYPSYDTLNYMTSSFSGSCTERTCNPADLVRWSAEFQLYGYDLSLEFMVADRNTTRIDDLVHKMEDFVNEYIIYKNKCQNASRGNYLMKIKDVEILQENKVVRVTFSDGETEKAICDERDTFSLERAIEICICKHLIGGTSKFNKAVRDGLKVYEDKLQAIEDKKAEEERIEKKRQKHNAYRDRCRQKAEQAEKEKQIEIQKEAYLQAMKEFNGGKKTKKQK